LNYQLRHPNLYEELRKIERTEAGAKNRESVNHQI